MRSMAWYKLVFLTSCALSLAACNLGQDEETAPPPPPPPPPAPTPAEQPAPAANEVVRYSGAETADQGTLAIRNGVRARRGADFTSEVIGTLMPGSEVERVARYGAFTLVSWSTDQGNYQGWIDAGQATRIVTVTTPTASASAVSIVNPILAVRPKATATTPAPTTTQPAPPPSSTLTPPKPSTTTTGPKPPALGTTTKTPPKPIKLPKLGK